MKKIAFLSVIFYQAIFASCATINRYDTLAPAGPEGIDAFPALWVSSKDMSFDFQISPYYTDATKSISVEGEGAGERPLFEEAGPWNLPGIYYNLVSGMINPETSSAAIKDYFPTGYSLLTDAGTVGATYKTITGFPGVDKPNDLYYSSKLLTNSMGGTNKFTTVGTKLSGVVDNIIYSFGQKPQYTSTSGVGVRSTPISAPFKNMFYTDLREFSIPAVNATAYPAQTASYKRHGLRFKATANFMPGIRAFVKGGVCQYKVKSNLLSLYSKATDAGSVAHTALFGSTPEGELIYQSLFTQANLEEAFAAFDIDPGNVSNWSAEDTFAAIEFTTPITFMDNSIEGVSTESLRLWPTLTAGVWMPTSRKPDANKPYKLFDIPVSNQAHLGGTVAASASLELSNFVFLNSGFSVSVFNTKTIDKYMLATNIYHSGLSLDLFQVSKKPGKTYLAWIGLFAKNFFENWTAHAQYSITSHLVDEITVLDPVKAKVFDPVEQPGAAAAFKRQMAQTAWSAHEFQAGLTLALTQNLEMSGSFRLVGMGENVPKTKTIMASFKLVF